MKQIPNLLTLLNLFLGCLAIVFALQTESVVMYVNDEFSGSSFNIPEKLTWAGIFIGLAAIIDFLDGFVARLLKATSPIGKELDSLADIVSFGVAPAAIVYQLLRFSFAREENGLEVSIIWLLPAFVLSCTSAYRLAKFNLDKSQSYNFRGLPTPAVGLLIASFPLILHFNAAVLGIGEILTNKWLLYGLVFILSYLMLSDIPFMGLKFKDYSLKNNLPKVILIAVGVLGAVFLQWLAVPLLFVSYLILSVIYKNKLT
ncbi:MAG TPA: CDP-diacylglycerol--serine O-phosphatidyltransferase [Chitinophagaceae bacterium]|nr:CDP-diacylglycerol--serine O-phosphatidyltransferase [Chitinophagaceae bacterium]